LEVKDSNPKNQNELLRCFAELSIRFCDRLLPFLMQKLEQNNPQLRMASLTVIKHLINSSKDQMSNKKEIVLSGLRPLLSDTNNKVRKGKKI
jgi:maestro heat-like repeat-containing protein family member 1